MLPLRRSGFEPEPDVADLVEYVVGLAPLVDVTVVDGSAEVLFDDLGARLRRAGPVPRVRHVRPDPWPGGNGKVGSVVTGVRRARHERVVIADDDVRYTADVLQAVTAALGPPEAGGDWADLVRPHNVFSPLPWHARWDTARSLVAVALGHDHPGTFALRRSTFLAAGGYAGDVLFENLELVRTLRAAGGVVAHRPDLHVVRRPPATVHFLGQRVRQAYDDLAQPARFAAEAALAPAVLAASLRSRRSGRRGGRRTAAVLALAAAGVAEAGRRRLGRPAAVPPSAAGWAPLWLAERAVCVWLALAHRARGGMPYRGARLPVAAHRTRDLRSRPRPPLTALHDGGRRARPPLVVDLRGADRPAGAGAPEPGGTTHAGPGGGRQAG